MGNVDGAKPARTGRQNTTLSRFVERANFVAAHDSSTYHEGAGQSVVDPDRILIDIAEIQRSRSFMSYCPRCGRSHLSSLCPECPRDREPADKGISRDERRVPGPEPAEAAD